MTDRDDTIAALIEAGLSPGEAEATQRKAEQVIAQRERIASHRAYADDLRSTASAYITAANAAGMDRNKPRRDTADYLVSEANRLIGEAHGWERRADELENPTPHTIRHQPIGPDNPGAYGRTHDSDCAGCIALGGSWGTDPRSEAYWSN